MWVSPLTTQTVAEARPSGARFQLIDTVTGALLSTEVTGASTRTQS